jgi:hypothetical protein
MYAVLAGHYCRRNILNKLTEFMAEKVNSKIISCSQNAKYFSVTAYCTPDISHVEQLSLTIRFVDLTNKMLMLKSVNSSLDLPL